MTTDAQDLVKPRILLVPNVSFWILAEMARQIQIALSSDFNFLIVPETILESRKRFGNKLIQNADLIHCMTESGVPVVLQCGSGPMPPIVSWIHHVTTWNEEHRLAVERSAAVVVCTEAWRRKISDFAGPGAAIHVVRYGVDSERFQQRTAHRTAEGIAQNAFVVGFFGSKGSDRDGNRKGIDIFVEVILRVANAIPNLHVVIVGPGWDELAAKLRGSGTTVTTKGFVPSGDLSTLYSLLDAYLVTARVEGGPCTVLESLACGTPVVTTRVGMVPDVIQDGYNGFSAEADDVVGLVAGLCMMAGDPELCRRMSEAARRTAEALPWAGMLQPLGDIYRGAMSQTAPRSSRPMPKWGPWARPAAIAELMLLLRRRPNRTSVRTVGAAYSELGGTSIMDWFRTAALLATR